MASDQVPAFSYAVSARSTKATVLSFLEQGSAGKVRSIYLLASLTSLSAYTIVDSTTHSVAVDILTSPSADIGTLFISSGEGTYFVEALADTNRNEYGIVDFEQLVGLEVGKVTASE